MDEDKKCDDRKYAGTVVLRRHLSTERRGKYWYFKRVGERNAVTQKATRPETVTPDVTRVPRASGDEPRSRRAAIVSNSVFLASGDDLDRAVESRIWIEEGGWSSHRTALLHSGPDGCE